MSEVTNPPTAAEFMARVVTAPPDHEVSKTRQKWTDLCVAGLLLKKAGASSALVDAVAAEADATMNAHFVACDAFAPGRSVMPSGVDSTSSVKAALESFYDGSHDVTITRTFTPDKVRHV